MSNKNTADYITSDERMIENNELDQDISIRDLVKSFGLTQKEFAATFHIPLATLRHWIAGERKCPEYTKRMLIYMVQLKKAQGVNGEKDKKEE